MSLVTAFSRHVLDREDARRQQPEWLEARRRDEQSRFLPFSRLRPAMRVGARLQPAWLVSREVGAIADADAVTVFLGTDAEGTAHFAIEVGDVESRDGEKFVDVRSMAMQLASTGNADPDVAAIGLARTLLHWNAHHRFCANCGSLTEMSKGGFGRKCAACSAEHHARVDPVAIMLAVDEDRCVLGRQPGFPPKMFSALAGFIEPGESVEDAVRREVKEEAGVDVGTVRYVASQPWPFPSSLMLGCVAQAVTFDLQADEDELEEVRWVSRGELREVFDGTSRELFIPPPIAIAHQLILKWLGD